MLSPRSHLNTSRVYEPIYTVKNYITINIQVILGS